MSSLHLSPSSARGRYFVRAVAQVFDKRLQADRERERHSRVI